MATTQAAITSTTYTDLGVAPTFVQNLGPGLVSIFVGSSPSAGAAGYGLQPTPATVIFQPTVVTDHTYACMFGGIPAMITYGLVLASATI